MVAAIWHLQGSRQLTRSGSRRGTGENAKFAQRVDRRSENIARGRSPIFSTIRQFNGGIPMKAWPFGVRPVRFICPVPSSARSPPSIVESTSRFCHYREGMRLAAAFMVLVAGVAASRTCHTISPFAPTMTRNRWLSLQSIRIGSVVFSLIAAPK
jgi:hypothetical protein